MSDGSRPIARLATIALAATATVVVVVTAGATATARSHLGHPLAPPGYVPGEVVVGYAGTPSRSTAAARLRTMGVRASAAPSPEPGTAILRVPAGESVPQALARLRTVPGVAYAVPNYVAHIAGSWIPNDPGRTRQRGGWQKTQWNFLAGAGVNAPAAWANLRVDGRPGGRGVVVALLDTGVAYRSWGSYVESPDFKGAHFVHPYDFVANNAFPLDREGHGTFVAGEIAEATNNGFALTGLAYGDQGLFLRREQFMKLGGFPPVRFMEDLFFSKRLRQFGRIAVARRRIFVSPRRWQQAGAVRQTLKNWMLTALAAGGVHPDRLAGLYHAVR